VWNAAVSCMSTFDCEVAQILDCCCALNAVDMLETEVLAAAADTAESRIDTCFTNVLLTSLRKMQGEPVSLAALYGHIIRLREVYGLEYAPFHVTKDGGASIVLQKLGGSGIPRPLKEVTESGSLKMLITAHLVNKITPQDVEQMRKWTTSGVPAVIRQLDIQFEGAFDSDSGMLLFSVPVEVWSCLRDDPAYNGIGIIRSHNKMLGSRTGVLGTVTKPSGTENMGFGSSSK